jgi:hypothetical protein
MGPRSLARVPSFFCARCFFNPSYVHFLKNNTFNHYALFIQLKLKLPAIIVGYLIAVSVLPITGSARYFYALNTYGAILLQNLKNLESFLNFSFFVSSSLPI